MEVNFYRYYYRYGLPFFFGGLKSPILDRVNCIDVEAAAKRPHNVNVPRVTLLINNKPQRHYALILHSPRGLTEFGLWLAQRSRGLYTPSDTKGTVNWCI